MDTNWRYVKELGTKGRDTSKVIEFLYQNPIVDAQKVIEITGASRGKLYAFKDYIDLFER